MKRHAPIPRRADLHYTIHDLPLWRRTYERLCRYEAETGINPLTVPDHELLRIRNFGTGSLADLRTVQQAYERTHPLPTSRGLVVAGARDHPLMQEP